MADLKPLAPTPHSGAHAVAHSLHTCLPFVRLCPHPSVNTTNIDSAESTPAVLYLRCQLVHPRLSVCPVPELASPPQLDRPMPGHPFTTMSVLLLALLLLLSRSNPVSSAPTTRAPAPRVDIVLNDAYRSPPILPNYVSFSLETYFVRCWIGYTKPRSAWVNLVRQLQLTAESRHPITFRVGGNSGDTSLYNPHETLPLPKLPGPEWQYNITDVDLSVLREAMQQTRSQLIVGLNMRLSNNYSLATDLVRAVAQRIGLDLVFAFEVGNEMDFYMNTYKPHNWTIHDYVTEANRYAAAIATALQAINETKPVHYQAGAVATDAWTAQLASVILANASDQFLAATVSASTHHYPTTACNHNQVTAQQLLSDDYAQREARYIDELGLVAQIARVGGVGLVVGEGNTASCYGANGVSNSYASALWTLDALFNSVAVGVAGWSFTVGGLYHNNSPYNVPVNDSAWQFLDCSDDDRVVVEPMYYAFRMFNLATANYAALLNARVHTTDPLIKVWPVRTASTGLTSVVVLHKNPNSTAAATVSVSLGGQEAQYGLSATLVRLRSSGGLEAQFGITIAGQTYDNNTAGMPVGEWKPETVVRKAGAAFEFELEALEAAVLQISTIGVKKGAEASRRSAQE